MIAKRVVRYERIVLVTAVTLVTGLAWLVLVLHHSPPDVSHLHGLGGWTLAFLMWMVMTVAMMLPPVMPWLVMLTSATPRTVTGRRRLAPAAVFVTGYFALWSVYCAAGAGVQQLVQSLGSLGNVSGFSVRTAGLFLLAAGTYQVTPVKTACLRHCRNPLGFLLRHWKDGPSGAFRMGLAHGVMCLGCCWVLMAGSFALGIVNLVWMGIVTVIVCLEKLAPRGPAVGRLVGGLLFTTGVWLVVLGDVF